MSRSVAGAKPPVRSTRTKYVVIFGITLALCCGVAVWMAARLQPGVSAAGPPVAEEALAGGRSEAAADPSVANAPIAAALNAETAMTSVRPVARPAGITGGSAGGLSRRSTGERVGHGSLTAVGSGGSAGGGMNDAEDQNARGTGRRAGTNRSAMGTGRGGAVSAARRGGEPRPSVPVKPGPMEKTAGLNLPARSADRPAGPTNLTDKALDAELGAKLAVPRGPRAVVSVVLPRVPGKPTVVVSPRKPRQD